MIDHIWSVLCVSSSIDKDSNNISLLNVLEQIDALAAAPIPEDSAMPISGELISFWVRRDPETPSQGLARLTLHPPDEAEPDSLSQEIDLDLTSFSRLRTRVRFAALPIAKSGRHYLVVEYQESGESAWQVAARIPLDVKIEFATDESIPAAR